MVINFRNFLPYDVKTNFDETGDKFHFALLQQQLHRLDGIPHRGGGAGATFPFTWVGDICNFDIVCIKFVAGGSAEMVRPRDHDLGSD